MGQSVILSKRDLALLRLLEMTAATAALLRKASITFSEEPFRDERRVRERLQVLSATGFVRSFPTAISGGGVMQYYRLSPGGYRTLHSDTDQSPARTLVTEIAPSRIAHSLATAEVIVHTLVASHEAKVNVLQFHRDGKLTLQAGEYRAQPDCHFQLQHGGRIFNVLFEIDNATEPLDSPREQSIRTKLLGYEAYQDWVFQAWRQQSPPGPRPGFRVVFLTLGAERAQHILWLAGQCARNPDRRLCYAGTQDGFLGDPRPLTSPLLNDHQGAWQCLVNLHPTAAVLRTPIRLRPLAPRRLI